MMTDSPLPPLPRSFTLTEQEIFTTENKKKCDHRRTDGAINTD